MKYPRAKTKRKESLKDCFLATIITALLIGVSYAWILVLWAKQ